MQYKYNFKGIKLAIFLNFFLSTIVSLGYVLCMLGYRLFFLMNWYNCGGS